MLERQNLINLLLIERRGSASLKHIVIKIISLQWFKKQNNPHFKINILKQYEDENTKNQSKQTYFHYTLDHLINSISN